jgi:methenyltetrahydromethanopterin cyclohydrolase
MERQAMFLNDRAATIFDSMCQNSESLGVLVEQIESHQILDAGRFAKGGIAAGLRLAEICLSGLGSVHLVPGEKGPMVQVFSDHPVSACLASQYAGWQISVEKYFAMGSGPFRAAYAKEQIFQDLEFQKEQTASVVGVLETRKPPTKEVLDYLQKKLPDSVQSIRLAFAPTASLAGTIQVVARSLETALHKLHELKFDLKQVVSGVGLAPLPPIGANDVQAIGWTNDAILYGGRVTLYVHANDGELEQIGSRVPSSASKDYGATFGELFARYDGDFYKIDPMLFSPAEITFHNLSTGKSHRFGCVDSDILRRSFGY